MIPEIRPGGRSHGDQAVGAVDHAALLGANVDLPEVTEARKHLEHARSIAADAAAVRAQAAPEVTEDLARRYHDGKLTLTKLLAEVAAINAGATTLTTHVLGEAERRASAAAFRAVAAVGDRWITDVLRPVVDRILEPLPELSEILPTEFVLTMDTKKMDRERDIKRQSREVRDAWYRYSDLVTDFDAVSDLADAMRSGGLVPVRETRPSEDFRWLRHDRLEGRADWRHSFILKGYRNGAVPGIYTEAEVAADLNDLATRQAEEEKRRQAERDAHARGRAEAKARLKAKPTTEPVEGDQTPPAA